MSELYNDMFEYQAVGPSRCLLQIWQGREGSTLILVTQRSLSDGASITNAAEIIASLVVQRFGLDPQRCVFIEHYPRELLVHSHSPLERREGRHKYVTFTWDGGIASSPQWKPWTKIELQALQLMVEGSAPNSQE